MAVPLPDAAHVNLRPPDAAEVTALGRGAVGVVAPDTGLTGLQRLLIEAGFTSMTGYSPELDREPLDGMAFAQLLSTRDAAFRTRIVQMVILFALVLRPLPREVIERASAFASALGVDESMLSVAREFAAGSLGLAAIDFERNGYGADWDAPRQQALHNSVPLDGAWDVVHHDPTLAARWRALEDLGADTLGRRVADFYRARGFTYPGEPGSAPPLLTQHDWVHVLADYGTTVESELEVFAFIARANDDPHAFSLLAMVVSLFETGYLRSGAGLFEYDSGHLSGAGVATRLADGLRRGALCQGSNDFLATDWFALAGLPLDDVRRHFGVPPKAHGALAAGSVGPWEPGGISPFQLGAGRAKAASEGREYQSFGASIEAGA